MLRPDGLLPASQFHLGISVWDDVWCMLEPVIDCNHWFLSSKQAGKPSPPLCVKNKNCLTPISAIPTCRSHISQHKTLIKRLIYATGYISEQFSSVCPLQIFERHYMRDKWLPARTTDWVLPAQTFKSDFQSEIYSIFALL